MQLWRSFMYVLTKKLLSTSEAAYNVWYIVIKWKVIQFIRQRGFIVPDFIWWFAFLSGQANTIGSVNCHNNHTVDITIEGVEGLPQSRWNESQWRLQDKEECEPTFSIAHETVTYTNLVLPDCALAAQQLSESIKYILKINPMTPNPGGTGQLRVYDQLYFVSCDYDNQNRSTTSFVPITNRGDNDSSM